MDCLGYKTCGGVLQHRECVIDKGNINLEISTGFLQGSVSKCTPSFFMHKTPTFTSRGFVIT